MQGKVEICGVNTAKLPVLTANSICLSGVSPVVVLLSLTAVCALLALGSYLCSVRIMEKKEF